MTKANHFRLLLIEDQETDATLFTELLAEISLTIELHHVRNGQQALDFLLHAGEYPERLRPQLIVLDLNMPVMDGHEFLRKAKARPALRWIPIIMLSSSERPEDIRQAYHDHASSYILKPVAYDDYHRLIESIEGYWRGTVQVPTIAEVAP
ncbi:response regulator [Deinococcus sp. KNUC1210]|uniref:response regulator n=1 Tax=Deinococcus sp. KNUC1210 TaxID=2917691 RepID=UPI001EF11377|nr:response regulator [Deinococcus sp. KNUC1210]ULH16019.1 response regulator [Deinococcus sp. KNUC1210]